MAKTTTITVTDDIDGSGNAQTYELTYDGASYTIDLAKKNKSALDRALKPFLEAATRVSGRSSRRGSTSGRRRSSGAAMSQDLGAIRAWARENGHQVADRGRISQAVRDAYHSART
jgi:nucleoid-associated protein Lsr2